ncbi:MAG: hypothetical protein WB660_22060 [Candidatus Sulfotelmatobacter sp.]
MRPKSAEDLREDVQDHPHNHRYCTQLLTFLSFASAAALVLASSNPVGQGTYQKLSLQWAIRFWVFAFVPILLNVLPVKEIIGKTTVGLERIRTGKVLLLWMAVVLILAGVGAFLCAMW